MNAEYDKLSEIVHGPPGPENVFSWPNVALPTSPPGSGPWRRAVGVYALWGGPRGETLLYIGQSRDIERRIYEHCVGLGREQIARASATLCADGRHALALEGALIRKLRPPLNRFREPAPGSAVEIVTARMRAGLTQREAAALVYVPLRTWQNWEQEHGRRKIPRNILELFLLKTGQMTLAPTTSTA